MCCCLFIRFLVFELHLLREDLLSTVVLFQQLPLSHLCSYNPSQWGDASVLFPLEVQPQAFTVGNLVVFLSAGWFRLVIAFFFSVIAVTVLYCFMCRLFSVKQMPRILENHMGLGLGLSNLY